MTSLYQNVSVDATLLSKYNQPLPRYTSYPPATELKENFDPSLFKQAIAIGNDKKTPLSLYAHLPFCEKPCYFCGCNTIITQRKQVVDPYLDYVRQQVEKIAPLVDKNRLVQQLHWGGGTPNYLTLTQAELLFNLLQKHFTFDTNAENSIEINPVYVNRDYILGLRKIGFNRISFGIQDFNSTVQEAVNRVQPEELLFNVMSWIREANFESVNVDLIYGLPFQTLDTFKETIAKTIKLNPDRIAIFNFAYVPWLKPVQKKMPQSAMPNAAEKLQILQMLITELTHHGYVFIGMDHFAKPDDELAIAQKAGNLHRNFQGYTTKPESDLLSFGVTSISMLQDVYIQNFKQLKPFYNAIDNGQIPIEKGVKLTQDDLIRRTLIMELMCQFQLLAEELETKYDLGFDLDFNDYFASELTALDGLEKDGLIRRLGDGIEVLPMGRLLIRNIAAVFDTYLQKRDNKIFSKAI